MPHNAVTMVTIKDSVHDHIDVEGVAEALLETPPVQRLRRIRQLGTVQLVYPSANHTRFEHSLGVFHLADRALEHLSVAGRQAERVRADVVEEGGGPDALCLPPATERCSSARSARWNTPSECSNRVWLADG